MPSTDDFVKSLALLVAWREEHTNQINGMLGALFVLRNRVEKGWFEGSWELNIESANQFSSMTSLCDSQTVTYPDIRDPDFQKMLLYVDGIYDGTYPDSLTHGALYFANVNNVKKDSWFDLNILKRPDEHPRVAHIGTTDYFK